MKEHPVSRKPWKIGHGWSLLLSPVLIPALFVGAALSIPYSMLRRNSMRRRRLALEEEMRSAGRLMTSTDFIREMEQGHGSLIVERFSFKGPVYAWWTSDKVYELCPHPTVDWLSMLKDEIFLPASEWYSERYTNHKSGHAFLVKTQERSETENAFWEKLFTNGLDTGNWVEIVPTEVLRSKRKSETEHR